jgi:hypothetical protein
MRRPRALLSVAVALVVLVAIVFGAIAIAGGGGDDEGTATTPATTPAPSEPPGGSAPGDLGRFPPEFIKCLEDQGIDVEGKDPIELFHGGGVPPQVLNECFGALHGGGGAP